ncbi:hypothetical protein DPMN_158358 [Dreissena polymorpha]|uniref:Uncharacterized protein n=1 Tax=Dreissena polymorpha TaxID=45954 RepID=A0A9D4EIY3_DREPO|nr:hypothetical protein DPMN_158358 [Dreissena polymorpha]
MSPFGGIKIEAISDKLKLTYWSQLHSKTELLVASSDEHMGLILRVVCHTRVKLHVPIVLQCTR